MEALLMQLLVAAFTGSSALNTWFMKRDLTGLRTDMKEERDARGEIEERLAAMEARCEERHK